jgi:DHA2 family multidrug resistance protein
MRQSPQSGKTAPMAIHPYVGILGVFLGAATSTLNGRLLSVGLADLRGAFGFGFDEASWIPTVLNMGMMFIGVFAVFLGAAYGIRRVLMVTGVVFTLTSIAAALLAKSGGNADFAGDRGNDVGSFLHPDADVCRA